MGRYMALRIIAGAYTYNQVITKRPDLKDAIDTELNVQGRSDLITE